MKYINILSILIILIFFIDIIISLNVDINKDNFYLRFVHDLQSLQLFNDLDKLSFSRSDLLYLSKMIVRYISINFGLHLGNSEVQILFSLLLKNNTYNGYYESIAEFITSILINNNLLGDIENDLKISIRSVLLAYSLVFKLDMDIEAAVNIALQH